MCGSGSGSRPECMIWAMTECVGSESGRWLLRVEADEDRLVNNSQSVGGEIESGAGSNFFSCVLVRSEML
jgi:hypothetical protein